MEKSGKEKYATVICTSFSHTIHGIIKLL